MYYLGSFALGNFQRIRVGALNNESERMNGKAT